MSLERGSPVPRARLWIRRRRRGPSRWLRPPASSRLRLHEALVDRLNETVRRPCAGLVAVAPHVSLRWLGRLYLCERSSCVNQSTDPIADDRHHVTVLDDVILIAETT